MSASLGVVREADFSGLRNRNSPRPRTGEFRVRDRFDAVEMPLKSTKKSKKARQKPLLSAIAPPVTCTNWIHGRGCAMRFVHGNSHASVGRRRQGHLHSGLRLCLGLGWHDFLVRTGHAHAHEQEAESLSQQFEQPHGYSFLDARITFLRAAHSAWARPAESPH